MTAIRGGSDIPELDAPFVFRKRPIAIPGDLRPTWRIGLLVLLLAKCCRGGKSSLTKLHVLNWGIRTEQTRRQLLALVEETRSPDSLVVRFEPMFNRAIDLALGEKIVHRIGGDKLELTTVGRALAAEIEKTELLFGPEKDLVALVRFRVTEDLVDGIFKGRRQ